VLDDEAEAGIREALDGLVYAWDRINEDRNVVLTPA